MAQAGKLNLQLVPEPYPLKKERRGGALNLLLAALLLEAGRMLDEGRTVKEVEEASRRAFKSSEGLLSFCQRIGFSRVQEYLVSLASQEAEDDLRITYDNFFSLKNNIFNLTPEELTKIFNEEKEPEILDEMTLEFLVKRFWAVAFVVAAELVGARIIELEQLEAASQKELGWHKGPFALMNQVGIQEAMRLVIHQVEVSHRKEINFPVPPLLINQTQVNAPWLIKSK